jgi:hypothetical protein
MHAKNHFSDTLSVCPGFPSLCVRDDAGQGCPRHFESLGRALRLARVKASAVQSTIMWDIVLAVSLGVCTITMAYMGVHLTLHTPASERKSLWKAGFIVIAIITCVLIGVQAYRSNNFERDLKTAIQKEGQETQQVVREEGGRPVNVQVQQPPALEPEDSLRKRTAALARELEVFDRKRSKTYPGYSTEHMTPEEAKAAIQTANRYNLETLDLYRKEFAVPTVAVVNEFKAKGVDASAVEEEAQYGYRIPELITSLRAMALRLDAQGRVKR